MDRASREGRRSANGLSSSRRQRHRTTTTSSTTSTNPLDEEMELRLRDRGSLKKEHHHHHHHHNHSRERERLTMMSSGSRNNNNSKRRRAAERLSMSMSSNNNDDDDDGGGGGGNSSEDDESVSNDEDDDLSHKKNFLPLPHQRVFRAVDEFIGVSVPRKARSACTKRVPSAGFSSSPGGGGEQIHRQASSSPVRAASPSSSNVSVRKKIKPNGTTKPKLPKSSSKAAPTATPPPPAAAQDEIEIEIAEVLYGLMRQPQKQENLPNIEPREAKSMAAPSPNSNSQSGVHKSPAVLQQSSSNSAVTVSVIAPKRKKPREVKYHDENSSIFAVRRSPISSSAKPEMDQPMKKEASSLNSEKTTRSAADTGAVSCSLAANTEQSAVREAVKAEEGAVCESKPSKTEETEKKKESHELSMDVVDDDGKKNMTTVKESVVESKKEEKFQIDLMATPSSRSSPEGEVVGNEIGDEKAMVTDLDEKPKTKEEERARTSNKEEGSEAKKAKTVSQEETAAESKKPVNRERNIDLQLDLERSDRDSGNTVTNHLQKNDKSGQSSSLPLPMPMAGWPGGLPPMGYMPPPFHGVVPMDGNVVPSAAMQPPQMLFTQPRPPRCAIHCYIARNICYHQQFTRMNPFLQAAAGSANLYGAKSCNLNVVPPAELHGNAQSRGYAAQESGQALGFFPGDPGKDKSSQAANITDAQRKQILLQQPLPPGPAFIFPLSQQQASTATSTAAGQQGNVKFPPTTGTAAASSTPNSTSVTAVTTGPATAPAMNFNFPAMPSNEAQYLAVLPNNAYPFPMPGHVGAPAYRGSQSQPMPFFSGPFYSSQMLHPSQFQQQQQQPPSAHSQQNQQPQSTSNSSSSSQKNLANQQGHHGSGVSNCGGSSQGFPATKIQTGQQQQQQQQQSQHLLHPSRQLGIQMSGENSTSTAESRPSQPNMSVYNQNFPVSFHPANFALITPASVSGSTNVTITNQGEQKQQPHQHGSQPFAMSFASVNSASAAPTGLDLSSIAQNHAFLQSLPEATRQSYQIMAAAAATHATQQKKIFSIPGEVKGGVTSSNMDDKREGTAGKPQATGSQVIACSRSDMIHGSVSSMPGSSVIDSSARNLSSNPAQSSASATNASLPQQQIQRNNPSISVHQQLMQLQKQKQYAAAAASAASRIKSQAFSSGIVHSDHHSSTLSMVTKMPNALSGFPPNLVQSSNSSIQSQPKNSGRTSASQVSSPPLSSSMSTALKSPPHLQSRPQQSHTQISFSANPKSHTQGQQAPSSNPSPPPHMVVGSPTTSTISRGSGGSPRTTASSSGNKPGQASALSSMQGKNSSSVQNQKSTAVGGRSLQSSFGNSHFSSSNAGAKSQLPQQQQLPKQTPQQHQLFFSTAYMPTQAQQHVISNLPANSGYYLQRRQSEQPQKTQQLPSSTKSSSSGNLSLCPQVTLANSGTSDPSKAAAAASNIKGAGLPPQGHSPAAQFAVAPSSGNPQLPVGFSYIHPIPAAVQVKPAEQKQPAGE